MKSTTAGHSNTKLDISFLNAPQHIEAEICENTSWNKGSISILQPYKELIEHGNKWAIIHEAFDNIPKKTK